MITQVLPCCGNLGCIIFATAGSANVIFTSKSIILESGDLFGSAYIVELGHYHIHGQNIDGFSLIRFTHLSNLLKPGFQEILGYITQQGK